MFKLIIGMCSMEGKHLPYAIAKYLKELTDKYNVDFYFKCSFDKANRTSINSYRGIGIIEGIRCLRKIKRETGCKILTDVHKIEQISMLQDFVDVIQIPAFLCRQTDLITAVKKTNKIVNIKKGQFIAPQDIKYIVEKAGKNCWITERGSCFGYNDLVIDFRNFSVIKDLNVPVIFDASHSSTNSKYVLPLCKAGLAYGIDGLYLETHLNPPNAKCDGKTSLFLFKIKKILNYIQENNIKIG